MLKHLFIFRGNISRLEFAINLVLVLILYGIPIIIPEALPRPEDNIIVIYQFFFKVIFIIAFYCLLCAIVRRWRDLGISLWWIFALFVPYLGLGAIAMLLFAPGWGCKGGAFNLFALLKIIAESDGEVNVKEAVVFDEICQVNINDDFIIKTARVQFLKGSNNPLLGFDYHLKQLVKTIHDNPDSLDPQWVVAVLVAIAEADGSVSQKESDLINLAITKFGVDQMLPIGFVELMGMLAKLAKSDGVIGKEEISVIDHFLKNVIQLNTNQRKQAILEFDKAKNSTDSFDQLTKNFAKLHQGNKDLMKLAFELLIQVSLADEVVSEEEALLLDMAAQAFNIDQGQYKYNHNSANSQSSNHSKNESYYAGILNLDSEYSMTDIRKQYKLLMTKNHPDKVINLSDVIRQAAENETKKINEAYVFFKNKYVEQTI